MNEEQDPPDTPNMCLGVIYRECFLHCISIKDDEFPKLGTKAFLLRQQILEAVRAGKVFPGRYRKTELDPPDTLNMALGAIGGVGGGFRCPCIRVIDEHLPEAGTEAMRWRERTLDDVRAGRVFVGFSCDNEAD